MAKRRAPLDEQTLRDTRDNLIEKVQDQRRSIGVPVPDEKTAADFVDPILRRVEVEHDRDRDKDLIRPDKKKDEPQGEWWGEPGHAPKITDIPGTKAEVYTKETGASVTFAPGGEMLIKAPPPPLPKKYPPLVRLALERLRRLRLMPEWKERIDKILFSNLTDEEKQKKYLALLADSIRLFGDPRKAKEPKLVIHGH